MNNQFRILIFSILLFFFLSSCKDKKAVDKRITEELPIFNEKPNIVYILADDLGYGELGCYGQTKIHTPNIDALAKNGMKFTQHYSGSPVCAPSRYSLLTGLHTGHGYIRGNDEWKERGDVWNYEMAVNNSNLEGQLPIPDSTYTLGKMLHSAGYKTALVGKWGLGAPNTGGVATKQGFDFFYGYNCQRQAHNLYPKHLWKNEKKVWLNNELVPPHSRLEEGVNPNKNESYARFSQKEYAPALMLDEALEFMTRNKENPFFLYFASPLTHVPLQAPKEYVDRYRKEFGEEAPYTGGDNYFPNQYPRATYAAMVTCLDNQVGQLVSQLKALKLYENTLIIFSSDNGPTFNGGSNSIFFDSAMPFSSEKGKGKCFVYEGGIRVPMIASWPGKIDPSTVNDHISAQWDIMSTLAEVVSIKNEKIEAIDGISFLPSLLGKEQQKEHEYLYWEFSSYGGQQAVRKGNWKAVRQQIDDGNLVVELYDLSKDNETKNVADQYPEIVKEIETILKEAHLEAVNDRFKFEKFGEMKSQKQTNIKGEIK